MRRNIWIYWRWQEEPTAPMGWAEPERVVALVEGLWRFGTESAEAFIFGPCPPTAAIPPSAIRAYHDAVRLGAVFVNIETPETLRAMAALLCEARGAALPERLVPALAIERQDDLTADAVRALCSVPAKHRALVVSPREDINLHAALCEHANPAHPEHRYGSVCTARVDAPDLVVVRGCSGLEGWPMHPAWARSLQRQCKDAGVAFALRCRPVLSRSRTAAP